MGSLVTPPANYEGPNRFMNWQGNLIEVGDGYSPFFLIELRRIMKEIEACIIGIFGGAGRGKTYSALRLAELLDPKFDPEVQVAFGPEEFLRLIGPDSPLHRGQVIIVDEAQFSAGSRNWYNQIQKDLMAHLEAVRSKGLVIFIIALNLATLDVIARNYTLTHMIHMKKRGHGVAYRFYATAFGKEPYKSRLGAIETKLPGCNTCESGSCLKCNFSGLSRRNDPNITCLNLRVRYERKKKAYLAEQARASETSRNEKKAPKANLNEIADKLSREEYLALDLIRDGKRITIESLRVRLQNIYNIPTTEHTASTIRQILENKYGRLPGKEKAPKKQKFPSPEPELF